MLGTRPRVRKTTNHGAATRACIMHDPARGTNFIYASGCPCTAAAALCSQQQHVRASQPVADNYALAPNKRTDEQRNKQRHRVKPLPKRQGLISYTVLPSISNNRGIALFFVVINTLKQ